jgi:hypothetical protein
MAQNTEELRIFVERLTHFMSLWTVYHDMLTGLYVPSVGERGASFSNPSITMMLMLYAYFYSLVEDSDDGLNAFRICREHFPDEDQAITAMESQIKPFMKDFKRYRHRLGFHGSRSRKHEASGWDLFANTTGTATWNAIKNFKALAATLLAKDMAITESNDAEIKQYRSWIDAIAERARQQCETQPPPR